MLGAIDKDLCACSFYSVWYGIADALLCFCPPRTFACICIYISPQSSDERLLHIEKLVNASHALYTKSADYQSSGIEELLAQLSLGLKEHMQTYGPESETRQNPEKRGCTARLCTCPSRS